MFKQSRKLPLACPQTLLKYEKDFNFLNPVFYGIQLLQHKLNGNGKQPITISGNSLEPGMYLYALVVDGNEVDTKRMILTK